MSRAWFAGRILARRRMHDAVREITLRMGPWAASFGAARATSGDLNMRTAGVIATGIVFGTVTWVAAGGPAEPATRPAATRPAGRLAGRAGCSSLTQAKQPLDKALRNIADLGYKWVDLSAVSWAPHVNVEELVRDFEKESARVEAAFKATGLKIANLTFDSLDSRPYETYRTQFEALVKLAAREKARLINLMAPAANHDRHGAVVKLRELQGIAQRSSVILTVETHVGQMTEKPADALWLCRQVPGLGLTLDPSHYYAGPNRGAPYDDLIPYVQGTGFRAGGLSWEQIQLPWGEGPIDFAAVVRKLESAGYKGFYMSEYIEGFNQVDAAAQAKRYLDWIRGL